MVLGPIEGAAGHAHSMMMRARSFAAAAAVVRSQRAITAPEACGQLYEDHPVQPAFPALKRVCCAGPRPMLDASSTSLIRCASNDAPRLHLFLQQSKAPHFFHLHTHPPKIQTPLRVLQPCSRTPRAACCAPRWRRPPRQVAAMDGVVRRARFTPDDGERWLGLGRGRDAMGMRRGGGLGCCSV